METPLGPEQLEPGGRGDMPRRRWPVVLGLAALGLASAAVYVAAAPAGGPRVYTATAAVDVNLTATEPSGGIVLIPGLFPDLHGQAQVVRSVSVATVAGRMMHSSLSPSALSKKVTVRVRPNSAVLDIACADRSARRAATCANDFAQAYLNSRDCAAANVVNAQVNRLSGALGSVDRARAKLNTKIAALPPGSAARVVDEAQLRSDHGELSSLGRQIQSVVGQLTSGPSGGSIKIRATAPEKPRGPSKLLALPAGLVAGLLLGLVAAFLLSRRDKRLHGEEAAR
jgi:uncharacterized protein involved in exopolysaccharide biosynthesis